MKTFNEFKKDCSDLFATCDGCHYSYELGIGSDNVPFCKVYARKEKMMLGSVVFESIPSDTTYFVSIDIIREVPYVYIYPTNFPFNK